MQCVTPARMSCLIVVAAGLVGGAALLAQDAPATRPPFPSAPPELKPGEIVIKRTGRTKRVAAAARPAPAPSAADRPADLSYDGPGPRTVTIGYLVRDPIETGWGPQVHCPAPPPYAFGYGGSYDAFGHGSFAPTFGFGAPLLFDSPSYCLPAAPVTRGFRGR